MLNVSCARQAAKQFKTGSCAGSDIGAVLASIADELEDFGKGQQEDGEGGAAEPRRQRRLSQRGCDALSPPVTPRRTSSRSLMRSLGSLARGY